MMRGSLIALALVATTSLSNGFSPFQVVVPTPTKTTLFAAPINDDYHKGGNAGYQTPVVKPARLSEEEDCEDPFIDLATGDELCWGEAPSHPKNVMASATSVKTSAARTTVPTVVAEDYHKGGNALYQAVHPPRKLEDLDIDEECIAPFMDFVSGDELCWNDAYNAEKKEQA